FALTASAQLTSANRALVPQLSNLTEATTSTKSNVALNEAGPADIAGEYILGAIDDSDCNTAVPVTITVGTTEGTYSIAGLLGFPDAVNTGTYDQATGKLTIPANQYMYTDPEYKEVTLCAMPNAQQFSKTTNIVFTFDAEGNATLDNYGLIAMIFNYMPGQAYNLNSPFFGCELYPVNGKITSDLVDNNINYTKTTEFPTSTIFTDNGGIVYGLDGITYNHFTIDENNGVHFVQEDVYNYSTAYKNAIIAAGGLTAQNTWGILPTEGPAGTIDKEEGIITMNPWCLILESAKTAGSFGILNGNKAQSVITFPPVKEDPTGISDVKVGNTVPALDYSKPVFNLAGQQVTIDESSRGFFIQNGHK
ncbi:MAG: hypothetical protein KBT10_06435, partial [Bacteroidales bacterium]|nr:hypothetical protein [Candidatus Sodaliphilus aphodohippi]